MPGTSWLKAPRTPVFKVGIHRAQRFVHGAWLTPLEAGYSRAVPLRFLPAFPPKAKSVGMTARTEGEAGLSFLHWTRQCLDEEGREPQLLLALADGSFDTLNVWRGLPERTVLAVRTARNRRLCYLPQKREGPGRPASYGTLAPHPWEWLHKHSTWPKRDISVRGKMILMKFQVLGPFVREGLPEIPMFLLVVKGMHRKVGKKKLRWKHRKPSFYLVNAVQVHGEWQLPLPIETILAWLWQRWEMEVAHREMKSGFGVGEKQCWNPHATIASVQWNVWVYALLLLSAYRAYCMRLPFRPVGGTAPNVGRSIPSGVSSVLPAGASHNFKPFGHGPPTTGSIKKLSSSLFPMPWRLRLVANTKRALAYPFCFTSRSSALAKVPKSRPFFCSSCQCYNSFILPR
jgi:hypothetical protein